MIAVNDRGGQEVFVVNRIHGFHHQSSTGRRQSLNENIITKARKDENTKKKLKF
jgi:hypothetical protein